MPIIRALAAQAIVLLALFALRFFISFQTSLGLWAAMQALGAAMLGRVWGLGPFLTLFQALLPIGLWAIFALEVPLWLFPSLLAALLLVNGGGIFSRAPLYNSGPAAWKALAGFVPQRGAFRFIDLGAGLGGALAHIANNRPDAVLLGVEASPLSWLVARLRTRRHAARCKIRFGSIWTADIGDADLVYAFLSPAPMPQLWAKARREMRPGALLISHSFEAPGQAPIQRIPLPGRKDAALLVYRVQ
jgi:SAM-dependent methyltransferase